MDRSSYGGQTVATTPDVNTGPDSIQLASMTDNGFMVVWMSAEPEEGYVMYGTETTTLDEEAIDARDNLVEKGEYYTHVIEVTDLLPETQYYYQIHTGTDVFNDGGSPFTFTTYSTLASPPPYETISGEVTGLDDYTDVVILLTLSDTDSTGSTDVSNPIALVTDAAGRWIASIADARTTDGAEYFSYSDEDEILASMYVYANSDEVTSTIADASENEISLIATASTTTIGGDSVDLLTDYGVSLQYIPVGVGGGGGYAGQAYYPSTSGVTPKTAISDHIPLLSMSLGMILLGSMTLRTSYKEFMSMRGKKRSY